MKIKVSEVDKMIKEEFQKMLGKKKLSSRLSQINEELGRMAEEDSSLEEVEAVGMQKTKSATGLVPGEQHGVKFEKIGTHLKEEDEEMEAGNDMEGGMDSGMESSEEEMPIEMGEFESKFAEIGKAIDAKLSAESGVVTPEIGGGMEPEGMGSETGDSDDDFEEVEVEPETSGSEEEVEEIQESVDEPLEGHSVAQETSADTVNDNMEKDNHVKEGAKKSGTVITESTKSDKNIFTEGLDVKKKAALLEELNRMKRFAGLSKEEE